MLSCYSIHLSVFFFNTVDNDENAHPKSLQEPLPQKLSAPLVFPTVQSSKPEMNGNMKILNNGTYLSPGTAATDVDADVRSMDSNLSNVTLGRGKPVSFHDDASRPLNIPVMPALSLRSMGTGSKKLKKFRKGVGDGYESDSAYLSEGGRKSKEKEKKKKFKANEEKRKVGNDAELDPDQRKRKRSFVNAVRGRKDKDLDVGYATDGSSLRTQKSKKEKSKSKRPKDEDMGEAFYETDGNKKSKTKSFFKLSGKSSKPDLTKDRATTPPVPLVREQMPLPIAQRFATTLASPTSECTPSLDEKGTTTSHGTSMPPTSLDGSRSTTSLDVSLPSARSSKFTITEVPALNLPSLSFQSLNVAVDAAQLPSPSLPSQLSPPVSLPSSTQTRGTSRDSQASLESSSSETSYPQSRTSASVVSASTSNISSSFTSHSHFQMYSPLTGHGMGAGSTSTTKSNSQHSHGHGYGQMQRIDTFGRPSVGSLPTSPPSSTGIPAAVAGTMTFEIARDVATVPLMMRRQQERRELEPMARIQDGHPPTQSPPALEAETYPRRMSVSLPPTAPLNISKGGLRIKPSLEKINLLGLRKDNREYVSGGATPPPISSSSTTKASHSVTSPMSAGQHGLPLSPMPPLQSLSSGNQTLSPHTFISAPNSTTTSPMTDTNPTIPSRFPSRPRLSLNPTPKGNQLVAPTVLAYYDIPPPSPPPMGPLPLPPQLPNDRSKMSRSSSPVHRNRSRSPNPSFFTNHTPTFDGPAQFPTPAQLRQRMLDRTPRKLPSDGETSQVPAAHIVRTTSNMRRGKESPFPAAPISQRTLAPAGLSSSGGSKESVDLHEGVTSHEEPPPRSSILSIQPGPLNNQERRVLDSVLARKEERRSSWIDFGDALLSSNPSEEDDDGRDQLDANGSRLDHGQQQDFLDRLTDSANRSEESAHSAMSLPSSQDLGLENPDPPNIGYTWGDSLTVGDRTSRWSGSIYSRMSIMDEEESNAARDRFVKRVEAMLAEGHAVAEEFERDSAGVGVAAPRISRKGMGRDRHIPPVPKLPDALAAESILRSEAVPGGRVWNKF